MISIDHYAGCRVVERLHGNRSTGVEVENLQLLCRDMVEKKKQKFRFRESTTLSGKSMGPGVCCKTSKLLMQNSEMWGIKVYTDAIYTGEIRPVFDSLTVLLPKTVA